MSGPLAVETVHDLTDGERRLADRPVVLERPPVDWERHRGDKRPKILPPPGVAWRNPGTGRKVGHRYYTRVTTYADAITEAYNLTAWKLRQLLLGAGQRPDYVALAAAYTSSDRDRDELDELVGKVLEAAGPNRADLGTALHALTERIDRGEDLGNPPEWMLPDLAAYTAIVDGALEVLLREPRTVCDELECAGTPDTIAVVLEAPPTGDGLPVCDCPPTRARVVDTKTGSIRYPGKMSTQLAIYSRSSLYDPGTGERTPLDVCPHWGVIVHLPVETGEAALFWLDLEHGWRGALLCGPVREWHRAKADDILRPFATVRPVKVVDGEVTRIEPRLASVNTKAPAPLEPVADITEALAASIEAVRAATGQAPDDAGPDRGVEADLAAARGETLPDLCAHSDRGLDPDTRRPRCRDCGEWLADPVRNPLRVRCATTDLLVESCACPVHRPDLAAVTDEGVEPDAGPTEIDLDELGDEPLEPEVVQQLDEVLAEEIEAEAERVGWPGVDDVPIEQLASGSDPDPLASEIRRCITARDLELLGTQRWREWTEAHRALAVEVHDRLDRAERVDKPRAALEAAIGTATTVQQLEAAMMEGAEVLTDKLRDLASVRWMELRSAERVRS